VTTNAPTPPADAVTASDWREVHRSIWARKKFLREFYCEQYFDRIVHAMPVGRSLEIGAGPGFFARYHRSDVVSDVTPAPHVDRVVDVHAMPFEDQTFDCVIGVDVVHHLYHPGHALAEIRRVLRPRGRLILVEPQCFPIQDPWGPVFAAKKDAMQGNATIPKTVFFDHQADLPKHTNLRVVELSPFSFLGFLGTGGFTRWGLPPVIGKAIVRAEDKLPAALLRQIAIKVFVIAERIEVVG
jgi:SAM-dependent methyltransferase